MIKQVFTSDDHDLVLDKSDCKATVGEHYDISVDYNKFMDRREGSRAKLCRVMKKSDERISYPSLSLGPALTDANNDVNSRWEDSGGVSSMVACPNGNTCLLVFLAGTSSREEIWNSVEWKFKRFDNRSHNIIYFAGQIIEFEYWILKYKIANFGNEPAEPNIEQISPAFHT